MGIFEHKFVQYSHQNYQLEGVWVRDERRAQFWFPTPSDQTTAVMSKAPELGDRLNIGFDKLNDVSVINPHIRLPGLPDDSNERLAIIGSTLIVSLKDQEYKDMANYAHTVEKRSFTFEDAFRQKTAALLGAQATRIITVFEENMLPISSSQL